MIIKLIFYYIYWSIRLRVPPWYYFQINAEWYNKKKGFYSKIDINQCIPEKWRLQQVYLDKNKIPKQFPVFLKPEWGQNSNGVIRIDNQQDFLNFSPTKYKIPYIVQYGTHEKKEYEIFYIRNAEDKTKFATINIAQSLNNSDDPYPINSVNNKETFYQDITKNFSKQELELIQTYLQELPPFRIARVGLKTENKADFLSGKFHIIEINLFAPLPIHLLDRNTLKKNKHQFIKDNMKNLVIVSKTTPKKYFNRFVFIKKIIKHYQSQG